MTQNYAGAFFRLTNGSLTGRQYTTTTGALDTSGLPATTADPAIASSGSGVGTLTFSAGTGIAFTRSTPVVPFDAVVRLAINVIDADGVAATRTRTTQRIVAFAQGFEQVRQRVQRKHDARTQPQCEHQADHQGEHQQHDPVLASAGRIHQQQCSRC